MPRRRDTGGGSAGVSSRSLGARRAPDRGAPGPPRSGAAVGRHASRGGARAALPAGRPRRLRSGRAGSCRRSPAHRTRPSLARGAPRVAVAGGSAGAGRARTPLPGREADAARSGGRRLGRRQRARPGRAHGVADGPQPHAGEGRLAGLPSGRARRPEGRRPAAER